MKPLRATVSDLLAALPGLPTPAFPEGQCFATAFQHGSMRVEFYVPRGHDPQTPHTQDELYFIVSGFGNFLRDDTTTPFGPGDVLFVPAGVVHRFENFSEDFATWVVFYGQEGGERP
ncbi:MAG: cupin domain-containing protein [Nibricoccus sp.]